VQVGAGLLLIVIHVQHIHLRKCDCGDTQFQQ